MFAIQLILLFQTKTLRLDKVNTRVNFVEK